MKFTKKEIAKILHKTPNISATAWEIVYFFNSMQFNPDEEYIGNIIEDLLNWRGDLNHSLEESKQYYENTIKWLNETHTPSKPLPKKILKQLEDQQKELNNIKIEDI